MAQNKVLQQIGEETARFMRGKYRLNETAVTFYGKDGVAFRQGKKTILSVFPLPDRYEFLVIFGKVERETFEARRSEFSQKTQEIYDHTQTLHDGKWMQFPITDMVALEDIKKLILIKKNPNRKPLTRENAVYGKCGHRCDLCVHYQGISDEFRAMLIPHLNAVYGASAWDMRCTGCDTPGCHCHSEGGTLCVPLQCLRQNSLAACMDCRKYPCPDATVGYRTLEHRSISADAVTWAILPYVPNQYE